MAEFKYIDLGEQISAVLATRFLTKTQLGQEIGMSASNARIPEAD